MKRNILKGMALFLLLCSGGTLACAQQQKQDTIVVSRDGTGKYRDIQEAVEAVRAFMDYTVTIYIKNGIYKEKLVIPSWVKNVQLVGEDAEKTIITYDDHANINKMGTFRTYTVKVEGSDITFKNLTIENNAAPLGQAVALHTEGDRLMFVGCRFLGNQDTIYTGSEGSRLLFTNCYIEGTTDFIWDVLGDLMLLRLLLIASLADISVRKAGTTGRIRKTKRLPVTLNLKTRVKVRMLPDV